MMEEQQTGIPVDVEDYARRAFVAAMREKDVNILPGSVVLAVGLNGMIICSAEDPAHLVNPFARGTFFGDSHGGKVQILDYFDPKSDWWKSPHSWHEFTGEITISPIQVRVGPIKTRLQPLLDVWFDPSV